MGVDLKTFLVRARAKRQPVDLGQFKLLNLADVRDHAGDNWPRVKRRVFDAGTVFLDKRVGEHDAVVPCDEGFMILFAEAIANGRPTIPELSAALTTFFLGRPETRVIAVKAHFLSVEAKDINSVASALTAPATATPLTQPRPEPLAKAFTPDTQTVAGARRTATLNPVSQSEEGRLAAWFRPVWDCQKDIIAANQCVMKAIVGGRPIDGRRVIATRLAQIDLAELDCGAQAAAFIAMMQMVRQRKRQTFSLLIHASSWADRKTRESLLDGLQRLPEPARRLVLVRVDGLDCDPARTIPILNELARTGVGLIAETEFGDPDLDAYADCGVKLFSCQARAAANSNSEGILEHEARLIKAWVQAASELKAGTWIEDIRDFKTVKDVAACGVRFLSGHGVVADRPVAVGQDPMTMVDIFRRHKAA